MEIGKIRVLKLIGGGPSSIHELAIKMGLSYPRTAAIVRGLIRDGYCEKVGRRVVPASNAKTVILRRIADKYNLETLFWGSGEQVLLALLSDAGAERVQRVTGLAQSTIYQTLKRLMGVGAVHKRDGVYSLADDSELKAFVELLAREREAVGVEPHAIPVHLGHFKLKKVPAGRAARGSKTAFSLFGAHGVDYASPYDYYVEPEHEVSIEEIMVHALRFAESRTENTMCAVFYLKNIGKIDPTKVKSSAKEFGVASPWVDLQNYARGPSIVDSERFLPWPELVEKAGLYGMQVSPPPKADKTEEVLGMLGSKLESTTHAYLFGGGNMLLRGLKMATKDLDIVVESKRDFLKLRGALLVMGFKPLSKTSLLPADKKLSPSGIYVSKDLPRFDLFTKVICNALFLTDEMKARGKKMVFGKLVLYLLSLEDVLLLKSITERAGDLEDMARIVRRGGAIDWDEILRTYFKEEQAIKKHFCFTILDSIELLQQREGIAVPIQNRLLKHCIDVGILQALAYGAVNVKDIRKMMDFPEYLIRDRVNKLAGERKISKSRKKNRFVVAITDHGAASLFK